ncbi:MAG: recombinase family protein [Chloroflexota bacterium]|nr:recombinase family protein [Chloroflexota bacterium]
MNDPKAVAYIRVNTEDKDNLTVRPRKRAVIYCRVSTDRQEIDGESLEYQEEKCRKYTELHDIDIVVVLHEAKSGYIHYTLREKLTFARQLVRDHMADMIIVFDLRRFSRNFVHSAMIFEEIESSGGQIVSVSENIDNSLTGKLIRSILAWSAESEREKIVEYANRHWQTRHAQNLPMATGRAPYGWEWADKDKTRYIVNKEEALVRLSVFTMFVDQDMSVRAIAHKLTEDGVLPPAKARGWHVKSAAWQPSTVHAILVGLENIGTITICKTKVVMTPSGKIARKPNENIKTIPDGIPTVVPSELYELAQYKLKHNRVDKSRLHLKPEDFLLKSHIVCKTCGYRMSGRYRSYYGVQVAYYQCTKDNNKYDACPDMTGIKADKVNALVWEDCCRVFESIEQIRDTISARIVQDVQGFLENSQGKQQLSQLTQEIAMAEAERDKHAPGSYYYQLVSQDIQTKQAQLRKYEEESKHAEVSEQLLDIYQHSVLSFLNFLSVMKGRYHEATFKERRNALDVLGVKVTASAVSEENPLVTHFDNCKEWLSLVEIAELTGIDPKILSYRAFRGELATTKRDESRRCTYVHRDELNRWLPTFKHKPRAIRDDAQSRVEIHYSPIFTGVQSSLM